VQRVHQLDTGALTELVDIDINLNDKLRQDFGKMNVGDEKEFSLTVKVLIGLLLVPSSRCLFRLRRNRLR
jgi:hypothetical protein